MEKLNKEKLQAFWEYLSNGNQKFEQEQDNPHMAGLVNRAHAAVGLLIRELDNVETLGN